MNEPRRVDLCLICESENARPVEVLDIGRVNLCVDCARLFFSDAIIEVMNK